MLVLQNSKSKEESRIWSHLHCASCAGHMPDTGGSAWNPLPNIGVIIELFLFGKLQDKNYTHSPQWSYLHTSSDRNFCQVN